VPQRGCLWRPLRREPRVHPGVLVRGSGVVWVECNRVIVRCVPWLNYLLLACSLACLWLSHLWLAGLLASNELHLLRHFSLS